MQLLPADPSKCSKSTAVLVSHRERQQKKSKKHFQGNFSKTTHFYLAKIKVWVQPNISKFGEQAFTCGWVFVWMKQAESCLLSGRLSSSLSTAVHKVVWNTGNEAVLMQHYRFCSKAHAGLVVWMLVGLNEHILALLPLAAHSARLCSRPKFEGGSVIGVTRHCNSNSTSIYFRISICLCSLLVHPSKGSSRSTSHQEQAKQ